MEFTFVWKRPLICFILCGDNQKEHTLMHVENDKGIHRFFGEKESFKMQINLAENICLYFCFILSFFFID